MEQLTWVRDDTHFRRPVPALGADNIRMILGGSDRRFAAWGIPATTPCRILNGYCYIGARPADHDLTRAIDDRCLVEARLLRGRWEADHLPVIHEVAARMRSLPGDLTAEALADEWSRLWTDDLPDIWERHFCVVSPAYRSLGHLVEVATGLDLPLSEPVILQLVNLEPSLLTQVDADIDKLAARDDVPDRLEDAAPSFADALGAFLSRHGHLGAAYDDLRLPSFEEEPWRLLDELLRRRSSGRKDVDAPRRAAAELRADIRAKLADRPEDLGAFDAALALALEAGPLAEDHNYHIDRLIQSRLRDLARAIGARLVRAGVIDAVDDVFYLHHEEVGQALRDGVDRRATVVHRAAELAEWERAGPPQASAPAAPAAPAAPPEPAQPAAPGELRGTPASHGTARGPARIVHDSGDLARVGAGDIMVCQATNPSWVPVLGTVAGLICVSGHVLSHAAVTARELGIPAVVGVPDALTAIPDGAIVDVDASSGQIVIVR